MTSNAQKEASQVLTLPGAVNVPHEQERTSAEESEVAAPLAKAHLSIAAKRWKKYGMAVAASASFKSTPKLEEVKRYLEAANETDEAELKSTEFPEAADSDDRPTLRKADTLTNFVSLKRSSRIQINDIDALKDKLTKQTYAIDIDHFYWETGWAQWIARSWRFHQVMLACIVAYSVWIAVDADYNTDDGSLSTLFVVVDNIFCCVFTAEWAIRFAAFERKSNIKYDAWFMFDTLLCILGIIDTWLLAAVMYFTATANGGGGSGYEFRLLRLLRLTRLSRTVRLLRMVPELLIMLKGMLAAARSMCMCGVLILAIVYVFGIAMKQSAAGSTGGDKYFSSVAQSMYSLLLYATLLDSPSKVLAQLNTLAAIVFMFVIGLSAMMLMNLLIGVLCEVVTSVSGTENKMAEENFVREKLIHILTDCGVDENRDAFVSKAELLAIVQNEEAVRALADTGCDVMELVLSADMIFQDGEGYERQLDFEEFLKVVMDLRGGNSVTLKDLLGLRKYIHTGIDAVQKNMERLEERIRRMGRNLSKEQTPSNSSPVNPVRSFAHSRTSKTQSFTFKSEGFSERSEVPFKQDLDDKGSSITELSSISAQEAAAGQKHSLLLEAAAAALRQQAALLQAAEVAAEQHRALLQAAEESSTAQRRLQQLREQQLDNDRLLG